MYKTNCPNCGSEHLTVSGKFRFVPLFEEGFYVGDAGETSEEIVECRDCGQEFSLEDLEIDHHPTLQELINQTVQRPHDDGTVGKVLAGIFPQTLRCKNPHCGKTFGSDEATYCSHIDSYLCPYCGGTDVC